MIKFLKHQESNDFRKSSGTHNSGGTRKHMKPRWRKHCQFFSSSSGSREFSDDGLLPPSLSASAGACHSVSKITGDIILFGDRARSKL